MKALIIYHSYHHHNTEKVAKAMGKQLKAGLLPVVKARPEDVRKYELVGFGSGIYWWQHHPLLLKFVDQLPVQRGKKAFIFSTSGVGFDLLTHRTLREKLIARSFKIMDEFGCKGYDTVGILKHLGGINRGRPNRHDLNQACRFAAQLTS